MARRSGPPFFGVIDAVLVEGPAEFAFDGAIQREHAEAAWHWLVRDVAPDLIDPDADATDPRVIEAFDALQPELLARARAAIADAATNHGHARLVSQLGSEEALRRLPMVLNAYKCKLLLEKAQSFGRAANGISDEAGLATALQSMPLGDKDVAALLLMAAVGQVTSTSRLVAAVIRIAGGATEVAILRTGFATLIDAIFAHAQNQVPALTQIGPFADIDMLCRAIDRFHRLMRSINGYVELGRNSRWSAISAALIKAASERAAPRLKEIPADINRALRRREGADRIDDDQILAALNGMYLLVAVRDARESLALNAPFDQAWTQVGQSLEIHLQRGLDALRADPADQIAAARLDAAIKMAELRFNTEYADVLRRAKEVAERR